MGLLLNKNLDQKNTYLLSYKGLAVKSFQNEDLKTVISKCSQIAKNIKKNLYVSRSAVGNVFIGFDSKFSNPVIFKDSDMVQSNYAESYWHLEGPFLSEHEASLFLFDFFGIGDSR